MVNKKNQERLKIAERFKTEYLNRYFILSSGDTGKIIDLIDWPIDESLDALIVVKINKNVYVVSSDDIIAISLHPFEVENIKNKKIIEKID